MFGMTYIRKYRWYIGSVAIFALGAYLIFGRGTDTATSATSYYVVNTVERGAVSSGIETTGEIIAAQKLDLDVYKQLSRIDVVNSENGSHVEVGDVIVSFDKSDAYVAAQSSRVSVAEAELALSTERENATDPNTAIRALEDKIAGYKKSIADAPQDTEDAHRDFLNTDLEAVPDADDRTRLGDAVAPTVAGRYIDDERGVYRIDIYGSAAATGYSFRLSGLETGAYSVYFGKAIDLGTRGLTITFPTTIRSGDTWVVAVPSMDVATYSEAEQTYQERVADIERTVAEYRVSLANAEVELANLRAVDTYSYRDLSVEKATQAFSEARQKLVERYDVIKERDIVAPFAGTIQDMENVVAGATPTGGTSDTINLGTLISDAFLTTFTLSATDVAKVSVGQKVYVTVTSFREQPTFEAVISEISSLPASSGVAQYTVRAELAYDRKTAETILREGMLATIEVVEEEKKDALRIPVSAVAYVDGKPTVQVVDTLTEAQQVEVDTLGIIRTTGTGIESYTKPITLGIQGKYFVEVRGGLDEGDIVLTSALAQGSDASVVEQAGFGPGRRPSSESGTSNTQGTSD